MTENGAVIADLVAYFLPMDPAVDDSVFEANDDVDLLAASLASFSVAVTFALTRMQEAQRREFCRQVAGMSEGKVRAWMAEAALRSIEGDHDAVTGTEPVAMSGIHMLGLILLSSEYLTAAECHDLRPAAAEYAAALRPKLAQLPR